MLTQEQQSIRQRIALEHRVDSWWTWLRALILRDFGQNFNAHSTVCIFKNHDGQWGLYGTDYLTADELDTLSAILNLAALQKRGTRG